MLDRRTFFRSVTSAFASMAAWQTGGHTSRTSARDMRSSTWAAEYEHILRCSQWLSSLGIPQNWDDVRRGLYPFTPERVAVIGRTCTTAPAQRASVLKQGSHRLRAFWDNLADCGYPHYNRAAVSDHALTLSTEKLEAILGIAKTLTERYPSGLTFEDLATGLALREEECFYDLPFAPLGSKSPLKARIWPDIPVRLTQRFMSCFGENYVAVGNQPVDWWVFLFPEGVIWDLSGELMYVQLGLVTSSRFGGLETEACELEAIKFLPILLKRLCSHGRDSLELNKRQIARMLNRELSAYLWYGLGGRDTEFARERMESQNASA